MIADQAILLDAEQDRYFCVGGAAARAVQSLLERNEADEAGVVGLLKAGLVEATDRSRILCRRQAVSPARSLMEEGGAWPVKGLAPVIEVTGSLVHTRCDLKRRRLVDILDDVTAWNAASLASRDRSLSPVLTWAATYAAARRLVPIKFSCLADSLALLAGLSRRGFAADLVFGVKLNPFSAHCWVQAGDMVLNDPIDHATLHTPILVV